MINNSFHLILGGARSGKSKMAEQLAAESGKQVIYIATATAGDEEMQLRIQHHQQRRPAHWSLEEEPTSLFSVLQRVQDPNNFLLVDCLTLWLSNCLHQQCWQEEKEALFNGLANLNTQIIFVSNETGLGITPMGALSRQFVDESGFMHQQLAQICSKVSLCVAGIPLSIKQ